MKVVFIQITDLHIKSDTHIFDSKIDNIVEKIKRENPKKVFLILGGDIVWSGNKKEYIQANDIISKIISVLNDNNLPFVDVVSVPGNHDIKYENGYKRNREEIKKIKKENFYQDINNELIRFENYYNFEKNIYQYKQKKVNFYDDYNGKLVKGYEYNLNQDTYINFIQINNAVYTFFDLESNQDYDNEKGLLFLPNIAKIKLNREHKNLNILIMHYPLEYYSDESRNRLLTFIKENINFVFTGHIHTDSSMSILDKNSTFVFFEAGEFNTNKNDRSEFNLITFSFDESKYSKKAYYWDENNGIYELDNRLSYENDFKGLPQQYKNYTLNEDFLSEVYKDDMQISKRLIDYFTFPKLVINNEVRNNKKNIITTENDFFDVIKTQSKIIITGDENSGKTALSKYIHHKLIINNFVLYTTFEDYNRYNKAEKIIRNTFMYQYNMTTMEQFHAIPKKNRILIIDDFDKMLNGEKIIEDLSEYFGQIIAFISKGYGLNPRERVDLSSYISENTLNLNIDNFYKDKREILVSKTLKFLLKKNDEDYSIKSEKAFIKSFTTVIENNLTMFALTPFMIILLVKHIYYRDTSNDKNIFNDVFTSNITMQINRVAKARKIDNLNPYITILQKIAFYMVINESNYITTAEIESIIDEYYKDFGITLITVELINLLKEARVITIIDNKHYFYSKNYLAYFASKEYIKKANHYEENVDYFDNLLRNLFSGVNDKILLFMAFSQQNDRIIKRIIENTEATFIGEKELDLEKFEFLQGSKDEINSLKPFSDQDKKRLSKQKEENEKAIDEKERQTKYDIYEKRDYSEIEIKFYNGYKYLKLVSLILPNFIHNINLNLQERIVKILYSLPNVLLNYQFKELDNYRDEIIDELYKNISQNAKNKNKSTLDEQMIKDKIYYSLVDLVRAIILSMYDMVARRSADSLTENVIGRIVMPTTTNNIIQKLMFESFFDGEKQKEIFIKNTLSVYKTAEKNKDILLKNCIKLIVRRYILDNDEFLYYGKDRKLIDVIFMNTDKQSKNKEIKSMMMKKKGTRN